MPSPFRERSPLTTRACSAPAALVGVLGHATEERINLVNAGLFARQRSLKVTEQKDTGGDEYTNLVTVEVRTNEGSTLLGGTSINGQVHLVRVDGYSLDLQPGRYMVFTEHVDRPGMIGQVGTIAGKHDVNISFMEVGRLAPRGEATMIVGLDDPPSDEVMDEFRAIPHVSRVRAVET